MELNLKTGEPAALRRGGAESRLSVVVVIAIVLVGWIVSSAGLFTIDEYFYLRAAQAMADEGSLSFRQFDVAGAPAIDMNFAKPFGEGRLVAQYPSGYALLAAPLYAVFAIKGLTLANALAGLITLWLTRRISRALGADEKTSALAVLILAISTFWSTYLYSVWPHMIALAILLGAIDRAIKAGEGDFRAALAAGLLVGLGQNIRIDMIVLAPAIIVWLRLFCGGPTRRLSAIFALGLAPGFLAAAWINQLKFGVFNPFTYENAVSSNKPSDFIFLAIAAAVAMCGVFIFDFRKLASTPRRVQAALAGVAVFAVIAMPQVRALCGGLWYALVDAQSYQHLDRQIGIERNQWGWLVFYGFSKKALAQSLPFLGLLIFPVVRLFRGAMTRGEGLLFLVMGVVATLYGFNQTDSGLGLNARFLTPLLPPVAILSAVEFRRLADAGKSSAVRAARFALIAFSAFLALRFSSQTPGPLSVPLDLYPQLALAAGVAAAALFCAMRPSADMARLVCAVSALGFGAAAAISATDFIRDQSYRNYINARAAGYETEIPPDSLVFTAQPILFARAASHGLGVAYPGIAAASVEKATIARYREAGRCIYAQGHFAADWLTGEIGLAGAPKSPGPAQGQGVLIPVRGNPARCP